VIFDCIVLGSTSRVTTPPAVTIIFSPAMTSVVGPTIISIPGVSVTPSMVSGFPAFPMLCILFPLMPMSALMIPSLASMIIAFVITVSRARDAETDVI